MKYAIAIAVTFAFVSPAAAQHAHGAKGPNGGLMEDVAGVHAELLTSGNTVTINVLDESSKPVSVKGYTASALVVNGSNRETVTLSESGDNVLKGDAKTPIARSSQITVMIKTSGGKSGQARFKVE